MQRNKYSTVICKDKKIANAGYLGNIADFLKAITCTKLSDFPLIMAIVLAKCTVLFILKVHFNLVITQSAGARQRTVLVKRTVLKRTSKKLTPSGE